MPPPLRNQSRTISPWTTSPPACTAPVWITSARTPRGTTGGKVRIAYPAMVLQLTPSTAAPIGPPTSGTSLVRLMTPFSPAFETSRWPTRWLSSVSTRPGSRSSAAAVDRWPIWTPVLRSTAVPALPSSATRTPLRTSSVSTSYPRRWAMPAHMRVAMMYMPAIAAGTVTGSVTIPPRPVTKPDTAASRTCVATSRRIASSRSPPAVMRCSSAVSTAAASGPTPRIPSSTTCATSRSPSAANVLSSTTVPLCPAARRRHAACRWSTPGAGTQEARPAHTSCTGCPAGFSCASAPVPLCRRCPSVVRRQRVLELAHDVLRALGVGATRVARLGGALAAVIGDGLLRARRRRQAGVVGQRLQRLGAERLAVDQALRRRPQALAGPAPRGGGVEDVRGVGVLPLPVGVLDHPVGEAVELQLLDAEKPLLLVVGVAGEVEREHVLDAAVVGHVRDAAGHQPALPLGRGVGAEVGEQVSAGHDVARVPRNALAVRRHGVPAADDGVLRVLPPEHRREHRVRRRCLLGRLTGSALEKPGEHDGEHLDVADLLRPDVHDHVLVLARDATAPALPQVLHHHGHLAELTAQDLLELHGEQRVGLLGLRGELQLSHVAIHQRSLRRHGIAPRCRASCRQWPADRNQVPSRWRVMPDRRHDLEMALRVPRSSPPARSRSRRPSTALTP